MTRIRVMTWGCAALMSAAACSEAALPVDPSPSTPLPPGAPAVLTVVVSTQGRDPDPNGFQLTINAGVPTPVLANGTLRLPEVAPGPYRVAITDVARWCEVTGGAEQQIEVGETGEHRLKFEVQCRATFRDWLLYDGVGELRLFDLTGDPAQSSRLGYSSISCGAYCTSAAVSPNGEQIAWISAFGLDIINANGLGRRRLVESMAIATASGGPSWSPDGTQLAYIDNPDNTTPDLYVLRLDGGAPPQRITFDGAFDPAWSPTGSTIVFSRRYGPEPTRELWLVDPTGANLRPVGASGVVQLHPSWSPDGQSILYSSDFRMRMINADGTSDHAVGPDRGFHAAWSRDGQRIAFVAYDDTGCRTWLAAMSSAGGDVVPLGPVGEACGTPAPPPYNPAWGY
jgi:hypothetical protein